MQVEIYMITPSKQIYCNRLYSGVEAVRLC